MRVYVLVLLCAVLLVVFNIIALNMLSPGSYDCAARVQKDQVTIESLTTTINKLKLELFRAQDLLYNASKPSTVLSLTTPINSTNNIPTIYMITPTYSRWTQKADLTRLCQTLMHIKHLHWIIVEDSEIKTDLVTRFLNRCSVSSTQLNIRTIKELQRKDKEPIWRKNRGVDQRNLGIKWLREFRQHDKEGVVYFGDDDNTYDIDLFQEIRATKKFSVWPVGICGGLRWEGPICEEGRLKEWHTSWAKMRPFPIDFAGFAVKLDLLLTHNTVTINPNSHFGWLESDFLSQFVNPHDAEGRANNCMKVLVWHTRTEKPKTKDEEKLIALGRPSNPAIET